MDENYPELLKQTKEAPYVLFVRGQMKEIDKVAVAVVGTRKPTSYGKQVVDKLVPQLVARGVTIVSGLAYGVDALAHRAAVGSGGRAIAVLGGGIDKVTPVINQRLGEEVVENGAIVYGSKSYTLGFF